MKRIARRIVAAVAYSFVLGGIVSACASEDNSFANPDSGGCDPRYCPGLVPGMAGGGCCIARQGPCGVDYGMGCMPKQKRDGG